MGEEREVIVTSISCPQALLPASNDEQDLKEGGAVEQALQAKWCADKCVVREFKAQAHGWVNRGSLKDDNVREGYEEAVRIILEFFNSNLIAST